jgi:hypothetical protein
MGTYFPLPTQVSQDPNDPTQIDPYAIYGYNGWGGFSPYAGSGNSSQDWGTAIGQAGQYVNPDAPMENIFAANRNQISTTGNQIGQQAGKQLNYYGPLQQIYQGAQGQALNDLQKTPGFTPGEASQINTDYSRFNTGEDLYGKMAGDPNAPVNAVNEGIQNEGAMLNQYQEGLGSQLDAYSGNLGSAVDQFGNSTQEALNFAGGDVGSAVGGLRSGLSDAQQKFSNLDAAVNNPALGFDPNGTEKQMTDADVQDLVTSAGTSTGNQFRTAEDTLERQAAAQGNTSPAALAAMRERLATQEGATAGDAMTNARIAALQAQYQRASGIEGQREGAVGTQTGFQANAAAREEAAAQEAAALAGTSDIAARQRLGEAGIGVAQAAGAQRINAADKMGAANLNAVNQYGQFSVGQENTMTGQQYGAQANAEQLATQRAAQEAKTRYEQGVGSQQATSQGAKTVGDARIAGEGAYRSGVAQQQGMAQQGGQAAQQTQLGAYGTQTSGINQAASSQGNFEVGKPSLGDQLGKSLAGLFEKGGVAFEPTLAVVGEHGPEYVGPVGALEREKVTPMPRYRSLRRAA